MAEVLDQHFSSVDSSVDSKGCTKLDFSEEEIDLITRMYILVGDRWSIIAGRIPGRSAEEIEKYWTLTHPTGQRVELAKGV